MAKYLEELDRGHYPHETDAGTEHRTFDAAMRDTQQRERDIQRLGAHRRAELRTDDVPVWAWIVLIALVVTAIHHFFTF